MNVAGVCDMAALVFVEVACLPHVYVLTVVRIGKVSKGELLLLQLSEL